MVQKGSGVGLVQGLVSALGSGADSGTFFLPWCHTIVLLRSHVLESLLCSYEMMKSQIKYTFIISVYMSMCFLGC